MPDYRQEKIDLINTLHPKVVDYDADGEICYYVYVPLDDEVKGVFHELGWDDERIKQCSGDEHDGVVLVDLTEIGFSFAEWWDSVDGFCLEEKER